MTAFGPSWLFVPGDRPERFAKAAGSGAAQVIVDLEDAVGPAGKDQARAQTAEWLAGDGAAWVRVNAVGTPQHDDDLAALVGCRGLRGVVVPKSEDAAALAATGRLLPQGAGLLALVETAVGIRDAPSLAAAPGVSGLAFGSIDFALDVDAAETDETLSYARQALVVAARAASLPAPVDGATVEIRDLAVLARAAARGRSLGFGGKLCIHPSQVPVVDAAFAPDPAELAWARRVLAAVPQGEDAPAVFTVDDQMVDRPVLDRARRIVARAGA